MELRSLAGALRRAALDWRRERGDVRLLRRSRLFDAEAYVRRYPDVAAAGVDPVEHYVRYGSREGRTPGPRADVQDYLERYPDVAAAGVDPLLHYLRHGRRNGRTMRSARPRGESSGLGNATGDAAPLAPLNGSRVGPIPRATRTTPLRLSWPVADRHDGRLRLRCDLGDAPALEATIDGPMDLIECVEPRVEPFVPIALLMAGAAGCDLEIEGPVDPGFLATLRLRFLPLLGLAFEYSPITMAVASPRDGGHTGAGADRSRSPSPTAGLLFSGGVDSFYSLIRLRQIGYPLRTLININAGAHDDDRVCMERRVGRVRALADEVGLDLVVIDTNFHQVAEIGHIHAVTYRNLSAAYTTYGAIDQLFLSNAFAYHELSFDWVESGFEIAGSTTTDSIAWARMPVTEIGYERGRFEKTRDVADEPLAHDRLDVCLDASYQVRIGPGDPINCGRCFKCARTLLTLEHFGRLERFGSQFDLEAFAADRDVLEQQVRKGGRVLDRDLIAHLDGRPTTPPPSVAIPSPDWVAPVTGSSAAGPARDGSRARSGPAPIKLFWSVDRERPNPNVGDDLSPLIVESVSGRSVKWASPEECELAAIGSLAEWLLGAQRDAPLHLWGTGFMHPGPTVAIDGTRVAALRGPLSAERMGIVRQVPLGDPGLLAGRLLERRPPKRQAVGLIPHVAELDLSVVDEWANLPGRVISPRLPVLEFLDAVAGCELILSSSLHGLIIADALGVPNQWVRLSDRVLGDGFKFRDHLRAVGRSEEPGALPRPNELDQAGLDRIAAAYEAVDLGPIVNGLVAAFPDL